MLHRGYDKTISMGCIAAGGALGVLIPPSVMMILFAVIGGLSVGKLFLGGIFSGFLLSRLFIIYIGIRCFFSPNLGPSLPTEQRASLLEKLVSVRALITPLLLIIAVLGSIAGGVATPTEAAAVGSFGAVICAAMKGHLNWTLIREACYRTLSLTSMIMWIMAAATCFSAIYIGLGAKDLIEAIISATVLSRYVILAIMLLILLVMGTFLDPSGIIMICTPIFLPIIIALGFDLYGSESFLSLIYRWAT